MKCLNPIQTGSSDQCGEKSKIPPPQKNISGITTSLLFCKGKGM